jgi:glyoxylase-like metal-dependent hydrolase (beta-lactamase superfamily II)
MTDPIILRCSSTNFYLLDCQGGKLFLDAGWPHCLPHIKTQLKSFGLKFADIRYVMMTHAHPDHAGLVQTLKRMCGARWLIHQRQIPYLEALNALFKRKGDPAFEPLRVGPDDLIFEDKNRAVLASIGVQGEAIATPGHSDDSISLALDDIGVFVGDLTRPDLAAEENATTIRTSWEKILQRQPAWVYPGHGEPIPAAEIKRLLRR